SPEPAVASVDPTKDAHSDAFYSTYASLKARWVRNIPVSGRLLEIGCGEGHFLAAAKRLGFEVTGLEPNVERATRIRKRLQVAVRCSLLEDVVWPDAGFDVIYHCDLLSHFTEPIRALGKMCSLLAPGGTLAFEAGTLGGINPVWYKWIGCLGLPQH